MRPISFYRQFFYTLIAMLVLPVASGCSNSGKGSDVPDTSQYTTIFGDNVLVFDDSMDPDNISLSPEPTR